MERGRRTGRGIAAARARSDGRRPRGGRGTRNPLLAILPCNNLDASERFYNRLGFSRPDHEKPRSGEDDTYRMLSNVEGAELHLTDAVAGWLVPGRNPFALYLRTPNVDALGAAFVGETLERQGPENKPWGMYEFSLADPDQTLVRVGWPIRLR